MIIIVLDRGEMTRDRLGTSLKDTLGKTSVEITAHYLRIPLGRRAGGQVCIRHYCAIRCTGQERGM